MITVEDILETSSIKYVIPWIVVVIFHSKVNPGPVISSLGLFLPFVLNLLSKSVCFRFLILFFVNTFA